jgi:hypothetical protein
VGCSLTDNHPFRPVTVVDIVLSCTPLEVLYMIVGLVFVDVVDLWEITRIRNERECDQAMNLKFVGFTRIIQCRHLIAVVFVKE